MARYVPRSGAVMGLMLSPPVQRAVHNYAEVLCDLAKEEAPVLTGQLRDSGHVEDTILGSQVVFDAPHAGAVHNGVKKSYTIYAKPGGMLHWTDSAGRDHFAKSVVHPPSPPNPFLNRAIDIMTTEGSV